MEDLDRRLMGKRIRDLRQRRGLTQRELAELSGLSESALRSYELGDRFPKERHLDRIARALRVRPEVFEDHDITTVDQVIQLLADIRLAGMISGGVCIFVWKFLIRPLGGAWNIYELLPAFIVSTLVILIVSLATKAPEEAICKDFESVNQK